MQQCLSVVRHYESLKLHIQEIRPDKSVDYLRQCHSGKKKGSGQTQSSSFNANNQNQRGHSQSQSRKRTWDQGQGQTGSQSLSNSTKFLPGNKCIGCGRNRHADWLRECPSQGKSCNKCGMLHHFISVCGMVPTRINRSQSRPPGRLVNELNQNNYDSLTSFPRNSEHENSTNMVPKQVLDVVNLSNSGINSGKNPQHHLELNTLSTTTCQTPVPIKSPTQVFSNIEIDGVLTCGKQDTGT